MMTRELANRFDDVLRDLGYLALALATDALSPDGRGDVRTGIRLSALAIADSINAMRRQLSDEPVTPESKNKGA